MSAEEMIAEARKFLATPNLGKPLMRELDKAMIYIRRLVDALETADARMKVLAAQVASIGVENPAGVAKLDERPDDSESDQLIAEADSFVDAILEIGEKYDVPLTNNMVRWQDGVFLRHAGDFAADVSYAAQRFIAKPLESRITELEAEAKEYRIDRIRRIGELQELAQAEARIAELEGGEWEYSWEGETKDGSWVLAKVFSCVEDAQAFAESTSGAWVKRDGGRMVKQHLGPWVPVESEVE